MVDEGYTSKKKTRKHMLGLEKAINFLNLRLETNNDRIRVLESQIKDIKERLDYNQIFLPLAHGKRFIPAVAGYGGEGIEPKDQKRQHEEHKRQHNCSCPF